MTTPLTAEEKAYANVNTSLADGAAINVLNISTTTANVFWADDQLALSRPIRVTHESCWHETQSFGAGVGVDGISPLRVISVRCPACAVLLSGISMCSPP
ncbi:P22 phage major capsid protein family protein [Shigella flexneri]